MDLNKDHFINYLQLYAAGRKIALRWQASCPTQTSSLFNNLVSHMPKSKAMSLALDQRSDQLANHEIKISTWRLMAHKEDPNPAFPISHYFQALSHVAQSAFLGALVPTGTRSRCSSVSCSCLHCPATAKGKPLCRPSPHQLNPGQHETPAANHLWRCHCPCQKPTLTLFGGS